jgi:hypothetical protein
MKRLALALTVFVSLMIPSKPSFAEWIELGTQGERTLYIDTKIRKHGGHIYFWYLGDYLKPNDQGTLSAKIYNEGDCGKFRVRRLQASYHTEPMGNGPSQWAVDSVPDDPWLYPPPGSIREAILELPCELAN